MVEGSPGWAKGVPVLQTADLNVISTMLSSAKFPEIPQSYILRAIHAANGILIINPNAIAVCLFDCGRDKGGHEQEGSEAGVSLVYRYHSQVLDVIHDTHAHHVDCDASATHDAKRYAGKGGFV